jgi:hypothetical protein
MTASSAGAEGPHEGDNARWEAAAQIRRDHLRWVVIWVALKAEYQARPLFRARPGAVAVAATPEALTAQMDTIEQAARTRPAQR